MLSIGGGTTISWFLVVVSSCVWDVVCGMLRVNRAANQIDRSNIILPVYFRKKVIAPLAILKELIVNRTIFELIVEFGESQDVVLSSFRGMCSGGSGFHQERPIA